MSSREVTVRLGDSAAIDRYGIGGLHVGHRVVYDVAANWKLIVENFMECYHCASIHPELVEVLPEFSRGHGCAVIRRPRRRIRFGSRRVHRGRLGRIRHACPGSPPNRTAATTRSQSSRRCSSTWSPTTSSSTGCFRWPPLADRRRMRLALHRRCGVDGPRRVATPWSCSTASTSRTSMPASEPNPRCRHGPTGTAACWFLPNTTSPSFMSG